MGRKSKHVCPPSLPGWLLTYGDMMSLLLTFFILLFAFSTVNAAKFAQVTVSLQGALGVLSGGPQLLIEGMSPYSKESKGENAYMALSEAASMLQEEIKKAKAAEEEEVKIFVDKRGLVVMLAGRFLFDPASAEIRPEAKPFLDRLSMLVASFLNDVRVEGHTAAIATSTLRFPSNWELAGGRASSVVRYFIEQEPLTAPRLSAVSYGEQHPVAPNDTPENREKNRRVEIVFERFREGEEKPQL